VVVVEVAVQGMAAVLRKIVGQRVLIVGDVMLDEYSWCVANRISPEAPVPVALFQNVTYAPGGCGNVAANVASLGGTPEVCSVIGDDHYAEVLVKTLTSHGVHCDHVIEAAGRVTTVKNRIIAHNQQMLRVDRETSRVLSSADEERLLMEIESEIAQASVCLLSDYAKGVVTPKVAQTVISLANQRRLPVVVDPRGPVYAKYRGATVITPNTAELCQALNRGLSEEDSDVCAMAKELLEQLEVHMVLTTRGANGMTLCEGDGTCSHIPAVAKQVFDVTGAGDTVVAMLALALADGVELRQAALLANLAAGIVVGKVGTATVSRAELLGFIAGVGMMG
jgi:rfaE bifunctional protein kinase chain/domain